MKTIKNSINGLITVIAFNAFILAFVPVMSYLGFEMPNWMQLILAIAAIALLGYCFVFLMRIKAFSIDGFLQAVENEIRLDQSKLGVLQKQVQISAQLLEAETTINLFDDIQALAEELSKSVHGKLREQHEEIVIKKAAAIARKLEESE